MSINDRYYGKVAKIMTVAELIEDLKNYPIDAKVTATVDGEVCEVPLLAYNEKYNIIDIGNT